MLHTWLLSLTNSLFCPLLWIIAISMMHELKLGGMNLELAVEPVGTQKATRQRVRKGSGMDFCTLCVVGEVAEGNIVL